MFFGIWGFAACAGRRDLLAPGDGYLLCETWGARMVHNRGMYMRFCWALMGPGVGMSFLIHRSYKFLYSKAPYTPFTNKQENFNKMLKKLSLLFYTGDSQPSDLAQIYLIKLYLMLVAILASLISLLLISEFSFVMPFVYRIRNLSVHDKSSQEYWDVRFRIVCGLGMGLPLQWANLIVAWQWKGQNIDKA